MRLAALTVSLLLLTSVSPGARQAQSASEVAAALQAKYDRVRDFSADFTQHLTTVLKRKTTESGKLQVKKPGKMRWDYTKPEDKLFVADGKRIYLWVPADKTVAISCVPPEDQATTAELFLVGKGNITRDFTVSFIGKQEPGTHRLRLQPKVAERDYDWLELVIDAKTLQMRSITSEDRQGGQSTFELSNIKENVGLADKIFAFQPPRGADVTQNDSSCR